MSRVSKPRRLVSLAFPSFVALTVPGLLLVARSSQPSDLCAGLMLVLVGVACLRPTGSQP